MVNHSCGAVGNKYGKTKAGKQRYKCNKCGETFVECRESYTKTEKRLLSLLANFLTEDKKEGDSLETHLKSCRENYSNGSGKITIKSVSDSSKFNIANAKVVICKDGNKILVYKVKEEILKQLQDNIRAVATRPKGGFSII